MKGVSVASSSVTNSNITKDELSEGEQAAWNEFEKALMAKKLSFASVSKTPNEDRKKLLSEFNITSIISQGVILSLWERQQAPATGLGGPGQAQTQAWQRLNQRVTEMEKELYQTKRLKNIFLAISQSTKTIGEAFLAKMKILNIQEFFNSTRSCPKELTTAKWEKWGKMNLPAADKDELHHFQPKLKQLLEDLAADTNYRIFSNKSMCLGQIRPDISITSALDIYLDIKNVIAMIELKRNLSDQSLFKEAIGQLISYINNAAISQESRSVFYGAVTDLRRIQIIKVVKTQTVDEAYTTGILDFIKTELQPTPGFSLLHRMLHSELTDFGLPSSQPASIAFKAGLEIKYKLGEGGFSVVYCAAFEGENVALKVGRAEHLSNETRVLKELQTNNVRGIPTIIRSSDSMLTLSPVGVPLLSHLEPDVSGESESKDSESKDSGSKGSKGSKRDSYIEFMCDVVRLLEGIHKAGWVHLDLRPTNFIILATSLGLDRIRIIDWGLAQRIGSSLSHLVGNDDFQSDSYVTSIRIENKPYIITQFDDLETIAYSLYALFGAVEWSGLEDANDMVAVRRNSVNSILVIAEYLEVLHEMRATPETLNYGVLANVLRGGKIAANMPNSPIRPPPRCLGYTKFGNKCERYPGQGRTYCFQHQHQSRKFETVTNNRYTKNELIFKSFLE